MAREASFDRRALLARAAGAAALAALGRPAAGRAAAAPSYRSRADLSRLPVAFETRAVAPAPGYLFVAPFAQGGTGTLAILDDLGDPVWLRPLRRRIATDFRVQRLRGAPVLTWWEGSVSATGIGDGEYVVLDGAYREVARMRPGNGLAGDLHEFQLTDRGTALVTSYRDEDGVLDCVVQELEVPGGRVVFEWRSLAHVGVDESYLAPPPSGVFDYFHVNSAAVDRDGNLLVSARNTWAVYKLDRATGSILWRLGGRRSDFSLGPGAGFAWQHDARRQPDGTLTLFDNADVPAHESQSRGLRLRLDETARTADLAAEYVRAAPVVSGAMGSVQALAGGGTLVGWGLQPYVTELRADGSVAVDVRLPDGTMTYRAYRLPWSGRPSARPAAAVERHGPGLRVYASWNGSTETVRWRVLGGDRRTSLRPLVAAPRTGFETPIRVAQPHAYVAVQALDARGRVLGRSSVVAA